MIQSPVPETKARIQSIDLLRGAVMIIMALDHCRDFFHAHSLQGNDPLDFKTTTPWLFLTRWITHFCAPVFVFLAGTSIFFVQLRRTPLEVSKFLITRGLWLILLELTLINWGWTGSLSYHLVGLFVIWALGCSMIFMSAFIHLPGKILLALGLLLVFGHNLLDVFNSRVDESAGGLIWSVFHVMHFFPIDETHGLFVVYPLIPWIGLMILGFMLGKLYRPGYPAEKRKKLLLQLGMAAVFLFVLLRSGNFYGDFHFWSIQATPVFTALSFIDTTKYPPSLLYALMTIGPGLIVLALSEHWKGRMIQVISLYGRVPFFYYLLHIYLIHLVAFAVFFLSGYHVSDLDPQSPFGGFPKGFGVDLWLVYVLWAGVVILLYFPCRWYNRYKSWNTHWWLSYL